jgi:glycerol-3-phosphate dehydrogenase
VPTAVWQAGPVNVDPAFCGGGARLGQGRTTAAGAFDRAQALGRLATEQFDVLVIGGGITGAGVALDAASRGLRTALVEKGDFSSGTSSKSSKLVHGGIRYLQQRELGLVYESLAERQRLMRNAPHLVTPLPFLIPLRGRNGAVSKAVARSYSVALWMYDVTGGWRIGARHRRLDRAEALAHLPRLRADDLVAGFLYFDAHADDARLTLAVLRTAVLDHGAAAVNYACAARLLIDRSGRVAGARVSPVVRPGTAGSFGEAAEGPDFDVRAHVVVNATGVWADDVRALEESTHPRSLRPAKGVHVTVPADLLPCDIAAVIPVPADRRSVFVVPWPECAMTYIGTTDTDYTGSLDSPACTPEDVDYLLGAVNAATTANLSRSDVTAVWAGLRPLLAPGEGRDRMSARTADLSRRHSVRTSAGGMVTVTGGKLTTYRKMAEDTMGAVMVELASTAAAIPALGRSSATKRLRLRGAPPGGAAARPGRRPPPAVGAFRSGPGPTSHLDGRYGTEAPTVLAMADGRPDLLEPVVEGLPYLGAEVVYAAREEMALSVEDVLCRRTRAVLQDARGAAAAAGAVSQLLAPELGWTAQQAAGHAEHFARAVRAELDGAGLPAGLEDRR